LYGKFNQLFSLKPDYIRSLSALHNYNSWFEDLGWSWRHFAFE